jgi:type I restriction enzyme R subunit
VREGVVLDLRYEAREVDQGITSQDKIDEWFDAKTKGLNDIAKRALKEKWGTMQQVLSSQSRLEKIVADILLDMATRPRLMDGHGNAMLVAQNIFDACRYYELFSKGELKGKCAIVTSYAPSLADVRGETTGAGETDNQIKYAIYRQMLGDWFNEPPQTAINKVEKFESEVKKKFINEPGQMKLLIVVDKLLTGFDAPSATYLYIDKQMRDHGLFQAICRVNRLDGDDKKYGYIVDYKDLFKSIERAVGDYTSGAFDAYDKEDVAGLLENRLEKAREALDDAREQVRTLCELVNPRTTIGYLHYFCAKDSGNADQLRENEPKRISLYKLVAAYQRAYANAANEMEEAGYSAKDIADIKWEVDHYTKVRDEVRLASGDYIDLKMYEPAMRHLIDTYIRAEESQKISSFDNQSLVDLIVTRGAEAVEQLPDAIKKNEEAVAEAIENNVRKVIINENPVNPEYYERMSKLLDALIAQRRSESIKYREYLEKIAELAKMVKQPGGDSGNYPDAVKSPAQRALYDNLGKDELLALVVDRAVMDSRMDDFRAGGMKLRRVRLAIKAVLGDDCTEEKLDDVVKLVANQSEY